MRSHPVLALAALLTGCTGYLMPPSTLHPSPVEADAAGVSAGVAAGAWANPDWDVRESFLALPYGEGWVRRSVGPGQLQIQMSPGMGTLGYRWDVGGPGQPSRFALQPALSGGLYRLADSSSEALTAFMPSLSGLVFVGAERSGYLAPRVGYLREATWGDGDIESLDHLLLLGGSGGYVHAGERFLTSVELSVNHAFVFSGDSEVRLWWITPSVGFQRAD
ncbi:MAG: hypothetical protein ABIO70_20860 [Pseudomonadota bacterium]